MSKQTAWAHLPNAHHIDRILKDVKKRPRMWEATWDEARDEIWNAAWDAALDAEWDAALDAERDDAWDAAWDALQYVAWDAARGAIAALIAWDDAGAILDMPPDAVRLLAASGHHPAVLLLPAAIVLSTTG